MSEDMSDEVKISDAEQVERSNIIETIINRANELVGGKLNTMPFKSLTKEEKTLVLKTLKQEGYTYKDIAAALKISFSTIANILSQSKTDKSTEEEGLEDVEEVEEEEEEEEPYYGLEAEILPSKIRYQGELYTPRELVITFGKKGIDILKTIALKRSFDILPIPKGRKFTDKTKNWIIRKFIGSNIYRENPNELSRLIREYTGLEQHIITDIIDILWQIDREFRPLIKEHVFLSQQPVIEDVEYIPRSNDVYETMSIYEPRHIPQRYLSPPKSNVILREQAPLTKEDIIKIISEYEEQKKKLSIDDRIKNLEDAVAISLSTLKKLIEQRETSRDESKNKDQDQNMILSQLNEIQSRLAMLESSLNRQAQPQTSQDDILSTLDKIEKTYEKITSIVSKQIDPITKKLSELESRITIPPTHIDDKILRLKELEIEKEIKQIESASTRESIQELAKTIEQAISKLGREIGRGIATRGLLSGPMPSNIGSQSVVVGDAIHVICPKCGVELKAPINAVEISCPQCNSTINLKNTVATNQSS